MRISAITNGHRGTRTGTRVLVRVLDIMKKVQ